MNDTFGLIITGENEPTMRELTRTRSVAAMPIAGRYRIIDILISNLVNADISNVGVITQRNYHSLMDHLGSGKEWDLSRKRDGLFILPPYVSSENTGTYTGVLDALRSNINYLRRSAQKYVLLTGSNTIYKVDFDKMYEAHIKSGADITVLYNHVDEHPAHPNPKLSYFDFDAEGRAIDMEIMPIMPTYHDVSMEVYLMEKDLLLSEFSMAIDRGRTEFERDIIQREMRNLKICGYKYEGYVARVDSIMSFFNCNMDMLNGSVRRQIFAGSRPVYTKVKDEVPAKYEIGAKASNSLVADGCIIEGTVENSILFRGVHVAKGAVVRNSIIMQAGSIGENCELDHVVLDKNVQVRRKQRLVGTENYPVVVGKNMII